MDMNYKFDGGKELEKVLRSMDAKTSRKFAIKAMRAGAKPIVAAARANAPVNSGRLRRAISVKAKPKSEGVGIEIGVKRGKESNDPKGAWYAHLVEFGTKFMPAHPFLTPAVDSERANFLKEMGVSLWKQIKREFKL
jgi:HK97 gp10 family phage protein